MSGVRRLVSAIAAALVAVLGTSLLAWTPGERTSRPPAAARPADPKPFSHADHVPGIWAEGAASGPEQARDCRGCHKFGKDGAVDTPQAECTACHANDGGLAVTPDEGWDQDMSAQRTSLSRSFHHDTHKVLACRQCHEDQLKNRSGQIDVPAHLPIPSSSLSCEECHGEPVTQTKIEAWQFVGGAAAPESLTPERLQQVFANINGRIAPPDGGPMRRFEHSDHVKPEFLVGESAGQEAACAICHGEVTTAGHGEAGLKTVSADGCKQCHLGDGDKPLKAQTERVERPSPSIATFAHSDHYGFRAAGKQDGVANDAAYEAVGDTSCGSCHQYSPQPRGRGSRDFPFTEGGIHTYGGCRTCHSDCDKAAMFATAAGLHASSPEGESELGWSREPDDGARACTECHAFGAAPMLENRRSATVERVAAEAFGFLGNAHPHITTAPTTGAKLDDCAECHVATTVSDLLSRVKQRPFRHDVHLSPAGSVSEEEASAECLTCHTTARSADAAGALVAGLDGATYAVSQLAGAGATNAENGCAACHRSQRVLISPEGAAPAPRNVAHFAHADHGTVACAACHEPVATPEPGGPTMTSYTGANCTECHDHKADSGNAAHTGRIAGSEIDSCATCHGADDVAGRGVPHRQADPASQDDPRYVVELEIFAKFDGIQYHPVPGDDNYRTCSACHQTEEAITLAQKDRPDHIRAEILENFHTDGRGKSGTSCYGCHWRRPASAANIFPDEPLGAETGRVRTAIGGDLKSFPGAEARSQ